MLSWLWLAVALAFSLNVGLVGARIGDRVAVVGILTITPGVTESVAEHFRAGLRQYDYGQAAICS